MAGMFKTYATSSTGLDGLVPFYFSKNNKKGKQISDEVAEAMASKIKFEAEQHRKNRDNHNYAKMAYEEEE